MERQKAGSTHLRSKKYNVAGLCTEVPPGSFPSGERRLFQLIILSQMSPIGWNLAIGYCCPRYTSDMAPEYEILRIHFGRGIREAGHTFILNWIFAGIRITLRSVCDSQRFHMSAHTLLHDHRPITHHGRRILRQFPRVISYGHI